MDGVPRVKPFALVACLLAVALAGCAGPGMSVEAPAWKSGFSWAYQWEVSEAWVSEEDGERENESRQQHGVTRAEVLNTTTRLDGTAVYVMAVTRGDGERDRHTDLDIVRQRDLASLPHDVDYSVSCMNDACTTSLAGLELFDLDVPTWLDFPLRGGKSWSRVVEGEGHGPAMLHRGSVAGMASVATPLGTVAAVRVDVVEMPADPAQFRRAILEEAAQEGYDVDTLRAELRSEAAVYYSPVFQSVVRYDGREWYELAATGTDPDGERFDFREAGEATFRSILDGARLVARAERSLDETVPYLTGQVQVDDPTGKLVEQVPFSIAVNSGVDTVDTAAGEPFSFSAEVGGDGSLPDGVSLRWSLLDWRGEEVAAGTGDAFAPAVSVPGRYSVALEAVDADGEVLAADGARAYGDLRRQTTLDCGPVATFFWECSTTLPVHPGVGSLHVEARSTLAGLPVDQQGSLDLRDAAGSSVPDSKQGGAWVVDVTDFSRHALGEPAWKLAWDSFASVAEEVALEFAILYSPERRMEVTGSVGSTGFDRAAVGPGAVGAPASGVGGASWVGMHAAGAGGDASVRGAGMSAAASAFPWTR